MSKKSCPKCSLNLPDEANFCPRCMYEYPRTEIVRQAPKKKRRRYITVMAVMVGIIIDIFVLSEAVRMDQALKEKEEEQKMQRMQNFKTGDEIIYDSEISLDLRDCMTEWETVRQELGEETKEPQTEGAFTVHTYENVEISVDDTGVVRDIYIRYGEGMDPKKYGLYSLCGSSTKESVLESLGSPYQNYAEEYLYRFEGREGTPTLRIFFSEDDSVEAIEYYRMQ